MRDFQWTPAQTGKEGLFRLVEQAQKSYKDEVTTRQKSYRRYVLDFTHSHRFHDAIDAWSKNEHLKNYHTVIELLRKHEILIRKHFDHDLLDENGIIKLLNEFYAIDLSESTTESDNSSPGNHIQTIQNTNIKPLLDRYTLDLIVQLANEVCLVRPARTYSKGCKSLNRLDSGKVTAKGKGVRRETESEGSRRQTSGLTDRNPI